MIQRKQIYKEIEKERAYQDSKFGTWFDSMNSLGHWIVYIEEYLNMAKKKFFGSRIPGGSDITYPEAFKPKSQEEAKYRHDVHTKEIINKVLKIAALCVATIEYYGE
jgi:hypothetical protein